MILVIAPSVRWAEQEMRELGLSRRAWRFVREASDVRGYGPETSLYVFGDVNLSAAQGVAFRIAHNRGLKVR